MKIYTKGGDGGQTSLWGGKRVPKDHPRIAAYGTLDELNSFLGLACAHLPPSLGDLKPSIERVQADLFQLGAELATPSGAKPGAQLMGPEPTQALEREIDAWEAELSALKTFILPGGSPTAAHLHVARTVARRAERELQSLHTQEPQRPDVLAFINRLSDWLFVSARVANHRLGVSDLPWNPPR